MRPALVTGFEPFAGQRVNPSQLAVEKLSGRTIAGRRIETAVLPVVFGDATARLRAALRRYRPGLVICVGEAGGRDAITIERVAINVDDARIADNAGAQPDDRAIVRNGPAAYWSTLPVKAIVAALSRREIPAAVSETAGTFVCNHVFYGLMRMLARRRGVRGGFIHVPYVRGQGKPSLPLATIVEGLELAITTSLRRT